MIKSELYKLFLTLFFKAIFAHKRKIWFFRRVKFNNKKVPRQQSVFPTDELSACHPMDLVRIAGDTSDPR